MFEICLCFGVVYKYAISILFIHMLLNKSNETMLEFRALAERVRVCQERLEKQEQALEDVSHVKPVVCVVTLFKYSCFCQLFQRYPASVSCRSPVITRQFSSGTY